MKRLSIKRLSKSGELLSVIECFSSQISVFRANSASELRPYQRALAGVPGPEKFSIAIDSQPYVPDAHYLIGFGERFTAGQDDYSVSEFLTRHGISGEAINSALYSFGLDEVKKTPCSSLNPCQERRLRILASGFSSPEQIIVLDDPFAPISGQWRERVAEALVALVKNSQRLIVVTSLTHRPECWIDNERIARIQVGQDLQKTIGFGTKNEELSSALAEVRRANSAAISVESLTPQKHPQEVASPAPVSHSQAFQQNFGKLPPSSALDMKKAAVMGGLLLVLGIVGVKTGLGLFRTGDEVASLAISSSLQSSSVSEELSSSSGISESSPPSSPSVAIASSLSSSQSLASESPAPVVVSALLLDKYPQSLKASIIEGFEGFSRTAGDDGELRAPRISVTSERESPPPQRTARIDQKTQTAREILSVLESTSETGDSGARFQEGDLADTESMTPEQRREIIRQRFLEAIQRASKQ